MKKRNYSPLPVLLFVVLSSVLSVSFSIAKENRKIVDDYQNEHNLSAPEDVEEPANTMIWQSILHPF